MKIEHIKLLGHLKEHPKGKRTWEDMANDLYISSGYTVNLSPNACRKVYNKHIMSKPAKSVVENKKKDEPVKFRVRKTWQTQTPEGVKWLESKEVIYPDIEVEELKKAIDDVEFKFSPLPRKSFVKKDVTKSHIVTLTDIHIGMEQDDSKFNAKWNTEVLYNRLSTVLHKINYNSDELIINILGDVVDNLNKETDRGTRIGSSMSNEDMIKESVEAVIYLLDGIYSEYDGRIKMYWLTNSNHASFGDWIVGYTLSKMIPYRYNHTVDFRMFDDFLNFYSVQDTNIIITHRNDKQYLKSGFPRFLGPKEVEYVNSYMRYHNLTGTTIMLSGDLHVSSDNTYNTFRDILVPALCTPSPWIRTNFGLDSNGGFHLLTIENSAIKTEFIHF